METVPTDPACQSAAVAPVKISGAMLNNCAADKNKTDGAL